MPIQKTIHGWLIETQHSAYALGLNPAGLLAHCYWGPRLPFTADYPPPPAPAEWSSFDMPAHLTPEEYPAHAALRFGEPCLSLVFADGTRDLVLGFVEASIDGEELHITLRDEALQLALTLHYRAHPAYDLIERWVTISNQGHQPLRIERVWSALWHLPPADYPYRLSHLTGRWADELRLRRERMPQGTTVLESRRLTSSHHHHPAFALDRGDASEEHGEVWFGALAWSGNWKLAAELTDFGATRLGIGLNDWDFAWQLGPGEQFVTPACYGGYSQHGFGPMSRALHDLVRDQLLPHHNAPRKVLYNSWEATAFAVDLASQSRLAELAAAMGVELFVMDDGWFHGRDSDRAGLGDWWPDQRKFPQGLNPLIERVNGLGMDFGLWVEPEMVSPDSELYRAHPDWAIHFPSRPPSTARNQLILNLARPDVQEHLIGLLDTLLAAHNIAFVKWDMNRNVSEPGWPSAPGEPREIWVRYVQGLYHVWGELRRRHPSVIWQSCSGGGGRADLGILRLADQIWVSDNTEPTARLHIQEGFSQFYPASTMEAWVTDMGAAHLSLEYRFHVSMCGALGVGGNLLHWSADQRAEAAALIARYKAVRHIVQAGDLFRLRSPAASPISALQYVSKDRSASLLFVFRTHMPPQLALPPILLRGLDPQARYTVEGIAEPRSGAAWMQIGLNLDRAELQDFQSTMRLIQQVNHG